MFPSEWLNTIKIEKLWISVENIQRNFFFDYKYSEIKFLSALRIFEKNKDFIKFYDSLFYFLSLKNLKTTILMFL